MGLPKPSTTPTSMSEALNPLLKFVDDVIAQGGFQKLPDNFRAEYRIKLAQELERRLGLMAIRELNEQSLEEFLKLTEEQELAPDELLNFFQTHIENFKSKMVKTLEEFAREFISGADRLRGQITKGVA